MSERRRSKFLVVRCTECDNEQVLFSHASTLVRCQVCGKTISIPRGGKAEVKAAVLGTAE